MLAWAVVAFLATAMKPVADAGPQLPYLDWGACPFEGCTYQNWQAQRPVTVWLERSHKSQVVYRVRAGEWVEGVTGVVITHKLGVSKVLAPMTVGRGTPVAVVPGDVLLTIHYLGEGYDLFWFKGRTYEDQIADEPVGNPPPPDLKIQVVSRPRCTWWVRVKNKKGQVGWTDQTGNFSHVGAFE
jgi:hypothetical protein